MALIPVSAPAPNIILELTPIEAAALWRLIVINSGAAGAALGITAPATYASAALTTAFGKLNDAAILQIGQELATLRGEERGAVMAALLDEQATERALAVEAARAAVVSKVLGE